MKAEMDDDIADLIPFYALGALTDEESARVEAYLANHPELRQEVDDLAFAASALPYSAEPAEPGERPKRLLMDRVNADRRARFSRPVAPDQRVGSRPGLRFQGFSRLVLTGLSLLIAVIAAVWVIFLNGEVIQLRTELATLREELQLQRGSLRQANISLDQLAQQMAQLTPSALTVSSLHGTEIQPDAQGQLIADPNSNSAVLAVAGLAPLEPGQAYQVWLIEGESPASAGLLEVNAHGQGVLFLSAEASIGTYDALGISIEPDTGSPLPSGEIVLLSSLF